jgi:AcrR family transcriptional regulator
MRLRALAAAAGLQAASLYNYFTSKEEFLFRLMCDIMEEILADLRKTVDPAGDPRRELLRFVAFHIRWHTERRDETFVSRMEMRSLSKPHYSAYVALRHQYEDVLQQIIEAGNRRGMFKVMDVQVATLSILAMLTDICNWFTPSGRLEDQLIAAYADLVLAMLRDDGRLDRRQATSRARPLATR